MKVEFELNEDNVELKTENIKLSDLTHICILSLKIIKQYSDDSEDINYDAILNAIIDTSKR